MTIEGGTYYASCTYDSPVGALTLAAGEEGLKGLWLEGQKYFAGESPAMGAQAVGGAVGRNPISIIVPCHRVVGAHGSLTGYAGGINRKLWLLKREGVDCRGFHIPARSTAP